MKNYKKIFHEIISTILMIAVVAGAFYGVNFYSPKTAQAATYTFTQNDWTGGATANNAVHPTNQSNWNQYSTSTSGLTIGADLKLPQSSYTFTDDGATSTTSGSATGGGFGNGTNSNTAVSGSGTGASVALTKTASANTWSVMAVAPGNFSSGGSLAYDGSGNIYAFGGGTTTTFWKYTISTNTWSVMAVAPGGVTDGGSLAYDSSGNIFAFRGWGSTAFWKYAISTNTWSVMAVAPGGVYNGGSLAYDGSGNIFAFRGANSTTFWKYTISTNTWSVMAVAPGSVGDGGSLAYDSSGNIYAFGGGNTTAFWKYTISTNTWSVMAVAPAAVYNGGSLAYDGSGNIYAFRGNNTTTFWKYTISTNTWSVMAVAPGAVTSGSLAYDSSGNIYAFKSDTTAFWRYNIYDQYASSGNFTSAVIDTGAGATWTTFNWNDSVPSETSISVKVRSSATSTMSGAPAWSGCTAISKGASLSTGGCVTNGHRYAQYQTSFTGNGNTWSTMAAAPFGTSDSSLTYNNSGNIYAFQGGNTTAFWKYTISTNTWSTMAVTPTATSGGALIYDDLGNIYALGGTTAFWKYSISGNTWSIMAVTPAAVSYGRSLAYDDSGNIFAFRGGTTGGGITDFWKYTISTNTWSTMAAAPASISSGSALIYDNSGNIYAFRGNTTQSSTTFWKYTISTNTWSVMAVAPGILSYGGSLAYDNSGNIYAFQGNNTTAFWKYVISTNTWSVMTVAPGTISSGSSLSYDDSGNIYGSKAAAFWKYNINTRASASFTDATISYQQYPSSAELTSSRYDASDAANLIAKISWNETATSTTNKVRLQIRSSPDGSTWSNWCGYSDTGSTCAGTNYFDSDKNNITLATNNPLRSDNNDRYLQYKVRLESDGTSGTAIADNIVITYVVNAAPQFDATYGTNGVTVSQVSTNTDYDSDAVSDLGKVLLIYSVRDPDALSGTTNAGKIQPSFEYSFDGSSWTAITSNYLNTNALVLKNVSEIAYTSTSTPVSSSTTSVIWNAIGQLGTNTYSTSTQIRVTASDNEAANATAIATSTTFTLDVKIPAINIFKIDSAGDTVPLNISDNSNISYKMSNLSDLSDAGWQDFGTSVSSTISWVPGGSPSYEKVYLVAKDAFGNTAATSTATAPSTPANIYYKDITNPTTGDYREFLSWTIYAATTSAAFSKYELYRSADAGAYSLYATITDSATNFYTDNSVASSTTYSYKMRYIDTDGDISNYSAIISDKPDGQGGTDITAPIITNVAAATVQSSWAKITWTTDEPSDSKVEFSTQAAGNYASSTSVVSIVTSHEVVLTNLLPNTAYVYRVKSKDINNNEATDAGGGAYTFTTTGGPVITSVSCIDAADRSFNVVWNTDKDSNSVVEYSVYSNLASGQTVSGGLVGETASTTSGYQHKISLSSLNSGTTYYFRVKSTDASSNLTMDDRSGAYYSCATTRDTKAPVISGILTPVIADRTVVVTWITDEPSTSQVEYGTASAASGSYSSSTVRDNTLTRNHVAVLTGLTAVTQHFYRVQSYDMNPDSPTSVSSEQNVTTATEKEIITNIVAGGGGGGGSEDRTPPNIGDISVVDIGAFEATVNFTTDEESTAFVEYGPTSNYGFNVGSPSFSFSHAVRLTGLRMGTEYRLRVKAVDKAGNYNFSLEKTFTTKFFSELMKDLKDVANVENLYEFQKMIEDSIESIAPSIVPPFIEEPRALNIEENSAIIKWKTNVPSYSVALYSNEDQYEPTATNAYVAESSDTENKTTNHEITLAGLTPNTKYHFMVKSYILPQAVGKSADMTFTTKAPKISPRIADIDNTALRIVWVTDESASSIVEYRNLRTGDIDRKVKEEKTVDHDVRLENLTPDTSYEISASGINEKGNLLEAGESLTVRTSRDIVAPVISNLKIDSTMVPGRTDRVQTIVSWRTNEPSVSIVEYEEGSATGGVLTNKVENTETFTGTHTIIIARLKPGMLYQIRVSSIDDAGNKIASPIRTIITPRQAESIVDVVVKNFEETFKFLQNIR